MYTTHHIKTSVLPQQVRWSRASRAPPCVRTADAGVVRQEPAAWLRSGPSCSQMRTGWRRLGWSLFPSALELRGSLASQMVSPISGGGRIGGLDLGDLWLEEPLSCLFWVE